MSELCIFSVACQKLEIYYYYGILLLGIGCQWTGVGNSLKHVLSVDSGLISISALLWATLITFTDVDVCNKALNCRVRQWLNRNLGNICVSFTVNHGAPNSQDKIGEFRSCWSAKCPFLLASCWGTGLFDCHMASVGKKHAENNG